MIFPSSFKKIPKSTSTTSCHSLLHLATPFYIFSSLLLTFNREPGHRCSIKGTALLSEREKSHSGCSNLAVVQLQVQYGLNMQPGMLEG